MGPLVSVWRAIPVPSRVAVVAGLLGGLGLPPLGRPVALLWLPLLVLAVIVPVAHLVGGTARAGLAAVVGLGPAVILLGVVHDLPGASIPLAVSALMFQSAWSIAALTLGRAVADRVPRGRPTVDAWVRVGAVVAVSVYVAGALARLLHPRYGTAERLAWMLDQEDNAHIVGVAREILLHGPQGLELSDQYGTAFINLPLAILRLLGGPLASEPDPRLQAVTLFIVSALVVIALSGLAFALLAALPHHVHPGRRTLESASRPSSVMLGGATIAVAALIGFSLLVVLPMRTGFITFVWGLTLVLLSAALVAVTPAEAGTAARAVLLAHLVGSALLLLSSWPFIGPAFIPLALVALLWIRWRDLAAGLAARPARSLIGAAVILAGLGLAVLWFLRRGPLAEVLSYGIDLLTVDGSGIYADETARRVALGAITLVAATIVLTATGRVRAVLLLATIGPIAGAGTLYLGMRGAAALLTEGVLGYSGVKLLYGVLVLGMVLGLIGIGSQATRFGTIGLIGALLLVSATHQSSPTSRLHADWWSYTLRADAGHAQAAVEAIRSTSIDIPIRCLPRPGVPVSDQTRWAAYFCVRWMEDAFNEGRFDGRRFDLLYASGPDFGETIERIVSEQQSEYLLAYRMTMGPGWFGWSGRED